MATVDILVREPFIHHKGIDPSQCRMVKRAGQGSDNIEAQFFFQSVRATSLLEATEQVLRDGERRAKPHSLPTNFAYSRILRLNQGY